MKTIFVYTSDCSGDIPKFFVMDGDFSNLDEMHLDVYESKNILQIMLFNILMKANISDEFPYDLYSSEIKLGRTPKLVRVSATLCSLWVHVSS